jgi:O-acetyl-ADP-ribose deacetylase (regulator of RNase III)
MQLTFIDKGREFCDVLCWQFREHPEVEIVCGRFEDLPVFDCVIIAGNSFGLMDAGMDLAIIRYFGHHVMELIQKRILDDFLGEQPVGTSIIIPTGNEAHPFVAHAPTMRIPMNICGTDHVYLAMWATLTSVHRHNRLEIRKIKSLACPGFGTGTGGMNSSEAALQLCLAYEHFLRPPQFINPTFAQQRHERIYYGGRWGYDNARPPLHNL